MGNILGGGPGLIGGGSRTTSTFRGNRLGDRQRRIATAMNQGFKTDFQRISRELQAVVVKEVSTGLRRPGASTGRLAKITGSPRNRQASNDFFVVGVEQYLLHSGVGKKKGAYALAVERGTGKLVGNRLTGVWVSGGQFRAFGAPTPNQFFRATSARIARKLLDEPGPVRGIIRRPILPHNDYDAAWDKYQPRRKVLQAVNRRLR